MVYFRHIRWYSNDSSSSSSSKDSEGFITDPIHTLAIPLPLHYLAAVVGSVDKAKPCVGH
jgi:hypothetical protein